VHSASEWLWMWDGMFTMGTTGNIPRIIQFAR